MKKLKSFILVLFFIFINGKSFSQTSVAQAQAIFIYNFTRLIEWPGEFKTGDFVIGIYGSSELFNEVKPYTTSKMVGNQAIKVVKFTSVEEISKCHIIFVGFGKTKELAAILAKLGNNSTLIITEKNGGLENGAAINFTLVEDKLKFELKAGNASKYGLKIHSNLENMAIAKY
jgi:hypothetical protein